LIHFGLLNLNRAEGRDYTSVASGSGADAVFGHGIPDVAVAKANACFSVSGLPTLAIDGGLHIERLPDDSQSGVVVRRILSIKEATDEDVLAYCERELESIHFTWLCSYW
jgi:hypothetical protein